MYFSFDHPHIDNFNRNGFIWGNSISTGGIVPPPEHLAAVSFSNIVTQQVAVVL